MICVEAARDGRLILRKDGRLLASSFDPLKEAGEWADAALRQARPKALRPSGFFVLGLASGYHVLALAEKVGWENLLVIENDAEIAREAGKIHPALRMERVIVEADWMKLAEDNRFRDGLAGVYSIASHGAFRLMNPDYHAAVVRLLVGRDKISFLLQLKARPDLWAALDPEKVAALGNACISVKSLKSVFSERARSHKARKLWRVLEELVV